MKSGKVFFVSGLLAAVLLSLSCSRMGVGLFQKKSPWEEYQGKLQQAGLDKNRAGELWLAAAAEALEEAPVLEVPFRAQGFFTEREVSARAWQFEIKRGGTVKLSLRWSPIDSSALFGDIFFLDNNSKLMAYFEPGKQELQFEAEQGGRYLLRLHPEIFGQGNFEVTVQAAPTYGVFPVLGKDSRAVQSFWGAARGGGSRSHEGIDIFADKGSPVVAPVSGTVTSVRYRGLGGKQVWLRDSKRGYSLYFAHLDSQTVSFGSKVKPGDTLGFVGNTGNAKFTPPHLHFGIYSGGAFDPFPVVNNRVEEAASVSLPLNGPVLRNPSPAANLRLGPGTGHPVLTTLQKDEVVFLQATTTGWYQVKTPDGIKGFVHGSLLEATNPNAVKDTLAWLKTNPFLPGTDSLQVPLSRFSQLGHYRGYAVVGDSVGNIYYRRNQF